MSKFVNASENETIESKTNKTGLTRIYRLLNTDPNPKNFDPKKFFFRNRQGEIVKSMHKYINPENDAAHRWHLLTNDLYYILLDEISSNIECGNISGPNCTEINNLINEELERIGEKGGRRRKSRKQRKSRRTKRGKRKSRRYR